MADDPEYVEAVVAKIGEAREKFSLQPIIFVGSGLSRRWIDAPDWHGLLEWAVSNCPGVEMPLQYFLQQNGDLATVASRLVNPYQEWAWGAGKDRFPDKLFEAGLPADAYLKYSISQHIKSFGAYPSEDWEGESSAFCSIRPHAVITTNYDCLLEEILQDYQPVLGSGLITAPFANVGEIFKIHGSVDKPSSLVLTSEDYEAFSVKRRYLTAKLLTFFAEHLVLFVGYSAEDTNVRKILEDLEEAVNLPGKLLENIFFLTRPSSDGGGLERILQVSPSKGIRVQSIEAEDFTWVFEAFGHSAPLANFNPKILRAILARSYNLVRSDIPKQQVEVNFQLIAEKVESDEEFASLFGIASMQSATEFSARYKYLLSDIGRQLGYRGWHGADKLLKRVADEKGVDLKATDNRYHGKVKVGRTSEIHKYTDDTVALLKKVKIGDDYEIEEDEQP
ncbi:SIR2 family protein [Jannaschia marina]|uniref:SIR2 family protein n=1 Tax=Jannaschia marina TaxID=2741674 RepID=UPI0015C874E6|nr:SIR2 family protein [Jannaschia marina]